MNNKRKQIFVIIGLVFIMLFSGLSISVESETLCSYEGPDTSEDYFQLSNFTITGNPTLYVDDTVSVEFKLTYVRQIYGGQSSVTFDSTYGVFLMARDPDCNTRYFGNTY